MQWVIIHLGPPPLYIKAGAAMNVTFQASEAQRFASEMEAVNKMSELNLPRDWFVTMVDGRTLEKL